MSEIVVVIIVFTIFILNLLKVIKLFNKDNIIINAKIIEKKSKDTSMYQANTHITYDYKMEYKINDRNFEKKYKPYFNRKENTYIKLIVNKNHGNIITTNLTRIVLVGLLIINSIFPLIMISSFFEMIIDLLIS